MGLEDERKFFRRNLLIGAGATTLLAACDPSFIFQSEQDQKEDKENGPQMGDIVVAGNEAELLRNEMRYQVSDLATYLRRSKTPGKIFRFQDIEAAKKFLSQYPKGQIPASYRFDVVQGDIKRLNLQGGEKIIYSQGFLSADSRPNVQIIPRTDAFVQFRKRLKSEGWDPDPIDPSLRDILHLDSYIFTYQEDELRKYSIGDTLRDPVISNGYALKFIKKRVEQNPFDQHTGFGHSLGGLWVLKMAMEYPEAFNNLILANVPIRGMPWDLTRWAQTQALKEALKPFGLDPTKVINSLFDLWNDPDYQKRLKKFFSDFTKSGRKIIIVYTEGDIIVPKESAVVESAEVLSISAGNVNPFNPFEVFAAHGMALEDERFLSLALKRTGKNLSTS